MPTKTVEPDDRPPVWEFHTESPNGHRQVHRARGNTAEEARAELHYALDGTRILDVRPG